MAAVAEFYVRVKTEGKAHIEIRNDMGRWDIREVENLGEVVDFFSQHFPSLAEEVEAMLALVEEGEPATLHFRPPDPITLVIGGRVKTEK